jgi:hypothetical protein
MNLKFWKSNENEPTEAQVEAVHDRLDKYTKEEIRDKLSRDHRLPKEESKEINETATLTMMQDVVDSQAKGGGAVSAPHVELHVENLVVTDPELFAELFSVAEEIDDQNP